jgi:hypothetical protein
VRSPGCCGFDLNTLRLGEPSAVLGTLELQAAIGALNSEAIATLQALRDAATG